MEFKTWLNEQFSLFRQRQEKIGGKQTMTAFAEYTGIPKSHMSLWLSRTRKSRISANRFLDLCKKLNQDPCEISFEEQKP